MARAKVDIPWPHQNMENGYVAYNWGAGDGGWAGAFWERRREKLIDALDISHTSYTDNLPELINLGERVKSIGYAEREKETMYLQQHFPGLDFSNIDDKDLIQKLNEIINGADQFKYATERIEAALRMSRIKTKSGENFKGMAPTMSSLFMSYLTTSMTSKMRDLAKIFPPNQAADQWKQNLDVIFSDAVDEAVENMLEKSIMRTDQDQLYGDATQWREIGEAYKNLREFRDKFKNMLRAQLNIEELKTFFDTEEHKKILKTTRRNKVKTGGFADALNWKSRQLLNNISGNVNEYITVLIENSMPQRIQLNENKASGVVQNKIAKTDTITMVSYEISGSIDVEKILEDFNEQFTDTKSLREAAEKFEQFYNENLAQLSKNNFMQMTNVKASALNSNFSGLHNGESQPIERLVDYIDMAGIDPSKARDFINVAYNTLENVGIFSDYREEVSDTIKEILTSAAARLLFDDWNTIGQINTGAQILNFFNIDGIIIPSSFFFIHLGDAMIKTAESLNGKNYMGSWFSVTVKLPTTVVYERGDWKEFGDTNEEIKKGIWEKWNEQASRARKEARFSTEFFGNLKSIFMTYLNVKI